MLNFDLFYSNNDYRISEKHVFPYGEVYGFSVYPDADDYSILQITKVYTLNKANRPVVFQISDKTAPVALLEFSTTFDDRGIFTDLKGNYCGCMCVSSLFITWVRMLTGFSFDVPQGSVMLNPSYCLRSTNGSIDCRLKINGEPVDTLTMSNGYFVKDVKGAYSLYNCKSTLAEDIPEQAHGLSYLTFTNGTVSATLGGKAIALNMLPPAIKTQYNKTYITVMDNTVHFQDAGLES